MVANDEKRLAQPLGVHGPDDDRMGLHGSAGGFCLCVLCVRPRHQSRGSERVCVGRGLPSGAISSTIQDPLTGHAIHKLRFGPIEVSSRIGFEGVSSEEVATYLNYTTTIVNGSDATLSVQYGGISIDGHAVSFHGLFFPVRSSTSVNARTKRTRLSLRKCSALQAVLFPMITCFRPMARRKLLTSRPKRR